MIIRHIDQYADDCKHCRALEEEAFGKQKFTPALEDWLDRDETAGFVAETNGVIVGFVLFKVSWALRRFRVWQIVVAKKWQRRKIATLMLRKVDSWALRGDKTEVVAQVDDDNLAGQMLLKSCGFECNKVIRKEGKQDQYAFTTKTKGRRKIQSVNKHI